MGYRSQEHIDLAIGVMYKLLESKPYIEALHQKYPVNERYCTYDRHCALAVEAFGIAEAMMEKIKAL